MDDVKILKLQQFQ